MLAVFLSYGIHAGKYLPEFIYPKRFTEQVELKTSLGLELKEANPGCPVLRGRVQYLVKEWSYHPDDLIGEST